MLSQDGRAMDIPFQLETDLERRITADPEWQQGAVWGKVRRGHPEGPVVRHIAAVLDNLDEQHLDPEGRRKLRPVALFHDTCKFAVDNSRPRTGSNHHARRARHLAERFVDDEDVLDIIELHDEAYNSWSQGRWRGQWDKAEQRAIRLLTRLRDRVDLYLAFYRADNNTEGKDQEPLRWFEELVAMNRDLVRES